MPKLVRGSKWTKKKHVSSAVAANPIGRPRVRTITVKATPIRDLLPLLWHDDYWLLIDQLLEQHPALVELLQGYLNITASRYKDRLDDQPLVRYLQAQKFKIATIVQTLVTTGHQLRGTHILKMAKSIVSLRQRLERKRWDEDVKAGLLLSKKSTKKYVEALTDIMPEVKVGQTTPYVVEACADQYHMWRGCKKGRFHRAVERTDAEGKKVKVEQMTVMNLHEYPVDNSLLGMTPEEVEAIRENGPYTEPASNVYDELDFDKAKHALYDMWEEDCELFAASGEALGVHPDSLDDQSAQMLIDIAVKLAARPQYPSQKTPMKIHVPRLDSDTNNYNDMQDFWTWILSKWPDAVAIILHLDGQGVGMLGNSKSIRPERYIACVPKAADLHGEAHFDYAGHEVYFESLHSPMASAFGFKKIEKRPMNLDQDRFDNHKYWNIEAAVACHVVLVRKFGIEMVSQPRRLEALVQNFAGYKVLFYFKLQAGGPAMMWQRAQRSNRASRLNELWAWGFHLWRCAHRTNYQGYVVQRAYAIKCTHPRLQLLLHQSPSMGISEKYGIMQGKDRRMEYFHAECTDYNQDTQHSVEDQLFFTRHFHTLDHVNKVYQNTLGLDDETPMEAKAAFCTTVAQMVKWMESRIDMFDHKPSINLPSTPSQALTLK